MVRVEQDDRLDCDLPLGAAYDGVHDSVIHSLLHRAVDNASTPVEAAAELVGRTCPLTWPRASPTTRSRVSAEAWPTTRISLDLLTRTSGLVPLP